MHNASFTDAVFCLCLGVVKEWVACERPDTPMDVSSLEESSGIRSWPPKSHENVGLVQGMLNKCVLYSLRSS